MGKREHGEARPSPPNHPRRRANATRSSSGDILGATRCVVTMWPRIALPFGRYAASAVDVTVDVCWLLLGWDMLT